MRWPKPHRKAFESHVQYERGVLRVCDDLHHLKSYARVFVVSFGKAAHRMAEVLARQVGPTVEGIIADPNPHPYQLSGYRYFQGGHPQPNEESVRAGEAILKTLNALNDQSLAIFLISGGGSAVVEKPADDEISLADLVATYKALVLSGAPIAQINAVRKHSPRERRAHGPAPQGRAAGFHPGVRRPGERAGLSFLRANHARFLHGGGLLPHCARVQHAAGFSRISP